MSVRSSCAKLASLAVAFLLSVGCDKATDAPAAIKIDSAQTATQSATRAKDVIRTMAGGMSFIGGDGSVLTKLLGGASDASGGLAKQAIRSPMPSPLMETLRGTPVLRAMAPVSMPSMMTTEEKIDSTADDLEMFIKARLLVESNVESKTDTEITYLLKPDPTCKPLPSSGSTTPDASCVEDLPKLQVRVVVRGDGDGARFQVLLGPDKLELSVLIIHSDLLAWETGLASAQKAADFANKVLGKPGEEPFPFHKLEGRTKVALQKLGDKKFGFSFAALEAIDIEPKNPQVVFKTAKSDPLFSVVADGVAKTATVKLGVGQTDIKAPWDPKDTGVANLDLAISSGGLYGETTLSEMTNELALKGLGIGQSFVAVRGTHIFDLNFNAANARKFNVLAKVTGADVPRLELTPAFDLSLGFKLGAIASDFSSAPPMELQNETYTINFVPAGAPAAVVEAAKTTATFGGGVKVVAGTLTLSTTSSAAATVTVAAGKCLVGNDHPAMGSHAILGHLASVACP